MKLLLKFLHTLGSVGLTGGVLIHLVLLLASPGPSEAIAYAAVRADIAMVATWVTVPSLVLVLLSGLLAIAAHPAFGNTWWVLIKALLSLSIFQAVLMWVQRPATLAADAAAQALRDGGSLARPEALHSETGVLYVILAVCVANIVLAIWRPNFGMSRTTARRAEARRPSRPTHTAAPEEIARKPTTSGAGRSHRGA